MAKAAYIPVRCESCHSQGSVNPGEGEARVNGAGELVLWFAPGLGPQSLLRGETDPWCQDIPCPTCKRPLSVITLAAA